MLGNLLEASEVILVIAFGTSLASVGDKFSNDIVDTHCYSVIYPIHVDDFQDVNNTLCEFDLSINTLIIFFIEIETVELEDAVICYNLSNNCSDSCIILSTAEECCSRNGASMSVLGNGTCVDTMKMCGRCKLRWS